MLIPNTKKSNLNIKKHIKKSKKNRERIKNRISKEAEILNNADVIFGIDNGATGTVSCLIPYSSNDIEFYFEKTFSKLEDDYQKDSQKIARIDWEKLKEWFENILKSAKNNYYIKYNKDDLKILIILERPMINADRFKQSKNAARAFEATLIVLEMLNLKNNYVIIDSKKWQHYFFGKNTFLLDLKTESKNKAIEYLNSINSSKYKNICELMQKHGDADSFLICLFGFEKFYDKHNEEYNDNE